MAGKKVLMVRRARLRAMCDRVLAVALPSVSRIRVWLALWLLC